MTVGGFEECFYCGGRCIWNSDADADEVGYYEPGIVAFWTCSECGAEYEVYLKFKEEDDANEETEERTDLA